jgi:hypothetical protein
MNRLQHRWQGPGVESEPAEELRATLIEQALRLDLVSSERVIHEALPARFQRWFKPMLLPADVGRLVTWFLKQVRPGHASRAADVLSAAYDLEAHDLAEVRAAEGSVRRAVHPLAEWLALNGAAKLRSRRRHELALDVVHAFHLQSAGLEHLIPCIRYVLLNEQPRRAGSFARRNPKSARTRFRRFMINCSFFDSSTGEFQRSIRAPRGGHERHDARALSIASCKRSKSSGHQRDRCSRG